MNKEEILNCVTELDDYKGFEEFLVGMVDRVKTERDVYLLSVGYKKGYDSGFTIGADCGANEAMH